MKKYEYVRLRIGKFIGAKSEEHRAVIDDYAARGGMWGISPPASTTTAKSSSWTWSSSRMSDAG